MDGNTGSCGFGNSICSTDMVHRQRGSCVRCGLSTRPDTCCRSHGLHCPRRGVLFGRVRYSSYVLLFFCFFFFCSLPLITINISWNNAQYNRGSADHIGTLLGSLGQERGSQARKAEGGDPVHSRPRQQPCSHRLRQDSIVPHSAPPPSFVIGGCLTGKMQVLQRGQR